MRSAVISQQSQGSEAVKNMVPLKEQVNAQDSYHSILIIASLLLLWLFLLC